MADPRNYLAHDVLKDPTEVTVRAIRREDERTVLETFKGLVARRFTGASSAPKRS